MTSSLVGSEDVYKRQINHVGFAVPSLSVPGGRRQKQKKTPLRRRAEPVSYTHLTLPTICSV
eukprot:1777754-Prorocentrum_lima.AAC.1